MCKHGDCNGGVSDEAFGKVAKVIIPKGKNADVTKLRKEMNAVVDEGLKRVTEAQVRMEKLIKQAMREGEDIKDEAVLKKRMIWERLEHIAQEAGVLPKDYSREKYAMGFDKRGLLVAEKDAADAEQAKLKPNSKGLSLANMDDYEIPPKVKALIEAAKKLGAEVELTEGPGGLGAVQVIGTKSMQDVLNPMIDAIGEAGQAKVMKRGEPIVEKKSAKRDGNVLFPNFGQKMGEA